VKKKAKTDLRPIDSRALKSLKDSLYSQFPEAITLELFAGTGRFTQTALEHGAKECILVELDKKTCQNLEKKFQYIAQVRIYCEDVLAYIKSPPEELPHLIFADPPFSLWDESFGLSFFTPIAKDWLKSDGIFVLKHPKRVLLSFEKTGLKLKKESTFGDSKLSYLHL